MAYSDIVRRLFGGPGKRPQPLPRNTVEHDSVDRMVYGNFKDDSPRFRRLAITDAPHIAPDAPDPDPIDFTSATPDEIKEFQTKAKAAKEAREQAPPYDGWEDLTRDIFYSYHHPDEPNVLDIGQVDPAVRHHAKISSRMVAEPAHQESRNITRDDGTAAAIATMGAVKALQEALEDELIEQARESQEFEEAREGAEDAISGLESLRDEAREHIGAGEQVPQDLVDQIKEAVLAKRAALDGAEQLAQKIPVAMDQRGHDAVIRAAQAGKEAAQAAGHLPSFGQGFGEGEPRYESPEQALDIAEKWATDPTLLAVSELYGRLDQHMRFERAKRIVGGQDEIVDIKSGDDIRRVVPAELGYLADDDFEDDFYMRYLSGELAVFDTVGEEHAGRGPVVLAVDESGSMGGEPNIWAKAIACCLLNICRREKRDFAYVGFSSGNQVHGFEFPAKKPLDAQEIIDMASHFYGGGTTPVIGIAKAAEIMDKSKEFKKADIVMVTDGEATFDREDRRIRDRMVEKGVRFHGIGIPKVWRYLKELCDDNAVDIQAFDLESPSEATAFLATHVT